MSSKTVSPSVKRSRVVAPVSDAQEAAVARVARKLQQQRGTPVSKADVQREALSAYCRGQGEEWPE